ncbi:tetratricopeptide repeat protein [Histidinibacterium aquaticum]|uniref:Tetratricopeptide repeat protein n=1 Tax=Histidinibacterium aquaticum TaxID=2613962 RepID=A0A5J5GC33_9RHOB|nr:tetratricopeptide repeat protein [Histidinibacterium aquaticum]KAA9005716.1 tetratricopeptide repeat protein [Histidinibacterium aquaticum]
MRFALFIAGLVALSACGGSGEADRVYAPGLAQRGDTEDQLVVGHRLMAAGQYELALDAFTRAAGDQGFNADTLSALGSANLRLGRLNQAEDLLRRAVEEEPDFAEAWNNLGVILMEQGQTGEAAQIFRRAFATSNGESLVIRDNLRLALAKLDDPGYSDSEDTSDFRLVQRGGGQFLLTREDP